MFSTKENMRLAYNESHDEFVKQLRELLEREDTDVPDIIDYVFDALRGDVDVGDISDLIHDRYIVERIKNGISIEVDKLREENKQKLAAFHSELEEQFARRVQSAVELQGIYQIIKDKIISDPSFLEYALLQIQRDIRDSKKNGEYPFLYQMTLEYCDKQQLIEGLIAEYEEDLLERYHQELKDILLEKHRAELFIELKKDLAKDPNIVDKLNSEIMHDLVKRIFG